MHCPPTHRNETCCTRRPTRRVDITVLGDFTVSVDGVSTPTRGWSRRNGAALVKILALTPGHRLHREKMMDLLWPDELPERCAPRLHKAAHFARQAAGHHDAIVLRDDVVWLFPGSEITVDALQFEELARNAVAESDAETARQALRWYGGELLPDDRYEDWARDRRELLHLRRLDVLRVAGAWRELAELDPTHEPAHVELIRRHLDAGEPVAARLQYEHLERVLDRELGVAPSADARAVFRDRGRVDAFATRVDALSDVARSAVAGAQSIDELLAELAGLVQRQTAVLAELAASGVATRSLVDVGTSAR